MQLNALISPHLDLDSPIMSYPKLKGICCFCAHEKKGYAANKVLAKEFTQYQALELYGTIICDDCCKLYKTRAIRNKHWIVTSSSLQFLQRSQIKEILLNPPSGPWAIYITESHKRHGWIRGLATVNHSKTNFTIIHEDFLCDATLSKVTLLIDHIESLLKHGLSKTQIRGNGSPMTYNKLMEHESSYLSYYKIKPYQTTPLFQVILYIVSKPVSIENSKGKEK